MRVTLNNIDAHHRIRDHETQRNEEDTHEEHEPGHSSHILRRVAKQHATQHAHHQRRDEVKQVNLRLATAAVASRNAVADLVSHVAAQQPHKRRGNDDGQQREPQHLELPAGRDQHSAGSLAGRVEDRDERRVDRHRPQHVREEHRAQRVAHAAEGIAVREPQREQPDVGPQRARRQAGVDGRPRVAAAQRVHVFAGELGGAAGPARLGQEGGDGGPGREREPRRHEVQPAPADGGDDGGRRDAQAHDQQALRRPDGAGGAVALMDEHHILHDQRDQRFHRARAHRLEAARRDVAVQAAAAARPEAADPGHDAANEYDWAPADADGERHQEVAADAVGQKRERCEERDLP